MPWQELKIKLKAQEAEAAADMLLAAGALSVSITAADTGNAAGDNLFAEPMPVTAVAITAAAALPVWEESLISALFTAGAEAEIAARSLLNNRDYPELNFTVTKINDTDWVKATQEQFEAITVGDDLAVVPHWRQVPPGITRVIHLDPGLAFGTGAHATTFLCLSWLRENLQPGQRVLDYGCGSGILAIAAQKLGAGETCGVDIDPEALTVSRANAAKNQVSVNWSEPENLPLCAHFTVVIANILANPLRLLAPLLAAHTAEGGSLVLAGLLDGQATELAAVYAPWFDLKIYSSKDGWALLTGRKKAAVRAGGK